jgi:hypothetical protein
VRLLRLSTLILGVLLPPGCERNASRRSAANPIDAGAAAANSPESCVDAWLSARKLDTYGHPEGTMYAGGTPLFDEKTGETTDRITYLLARHPDLKTVCPAAAPR